MTLPFVTQLRTRGAAIRLGEGRDSAAGAGPVISLRVEMPEVWDAVHIIVPASEPVLAVKEAALEALFPAAELHADFVLKLRGWEILDEALALSDAGVLDGSILLLTHRRRRAVR